MIKLMEIGQVVMSRYEVIDLICQGGQALLGKATDQQTGDTVVVKQLATLSGASNYNEELARFRRAAQIAVGHPGIVDPIGFGEEKGEWYIIMPFIDGPDLHGHLIANGGKLPVDQAVSIVVEIAESLGAAHAKRIVHRDTKPKNILIDQAGRPHLTDFGICRKPDEQTITNGDGIVGTLEYMSPEQTDDSKTIDYRSDLYSLGAVFYHMLTGTPPVKGASAGSIIRSILQDDPPSLRQLDPCIPVHIDEACMRLLAKHPDARFQTAEEFIQAVQGNVPPLQVLFCSSCGEQAQPGSRFCGKCGAKLVRSDLQVDLCLACGAEAATAAVCPNCGRSFGNSDHRFCFGAGSLTGTTFRVPEGIYCIGRNQLSPRDYTVSRQHFTVACVNGNLFLQDAGSANKTYVGDRLADSPIQLLAGQQITIAGNIATYTSN